MALNFNTATWRSDHGSDVSLDNIHGGPITVWAWVYRTADGANQVIIAKGNSATSGWLILVDNGGGTDEGQVRAIFRRATTDADVISISGTIPLNIWTFVAVSYEPDPGGNPEVFMYVGSLTKLAAEVSSYVQDVDGVGIGGDDAAADLWVGNLPWADTLPFLGLIATVGIYNLVLPLKQIQRMQYNAPPFGDVNCRLFVQYGFHTNGVGTQRDLSRYGNDGTVTGATLAPHVPIYDPAFGSQRLRPLVSAPDLARHPVNKLWFLPMAPPLGIITHPNFLGI